MCKLCMTMVLLRFQWSVDCGSQKHDLFFCGVCVHRGPQWVLDWLFGCLLRFWLEWVLAFFENKFGNNVVALN
ncbi:unnamed protein product [Sphagnum jensenii]